MSTRRAGSGSNLTKTSTRWTAIVTLALGLALLPPPASPSAVAKGDGLPAAEGPPARASLRVLSTQFAHKSGVYSNEALRAFVDRLSDEGLADQPDFGLVVLTVETAPLTPDVRGTVVRAVVRWPASATLSGYCFRKRDKRIGERYEPLYNVPNESGSWFRLPRVGNGESLLLILRLRGVAGELPRTDDQLRDVVTLEVVP